MFKKVYPWYAYFLIAVAVLGLQAIVLFWMQRVPICECGYIKFWHGITYSSENSQHLTDWYTFSHIIHGFLFFWAVRFFLKKWPLGTQVIIAMLIEVLWELVENSSFVVDRYRTNTISLDYYGDSVINSVMDTAAMLAGFWMAVKLPTWLIIILILIMEIVVGWWIRDNLTLNVIMLVYPLEIIKAWQSGV